MPLYEYQCQQCHKRVEKIQKFSDAPLTTCPHCGGTLERTLTAPAVQFKGSGWYKDLYSSAKPAAKAGAEGGAAASSGDSAAPASSTDKGTAAPAGAPAAAPAAPSPSTSGSTNS
jgi:putative FmdB family regulatory protein